MLGGDESGGIARKVGTHHGNYLKLLLKSSMDLRMMTWLRLLMGCEWRGYGVPYNRLVVY